MSINLSLGFMFAAPLRKCNHHGVDSGHWLERDCTLLSVVCDLALHMLPRPSDFVAADVTLLLPKLEELVRAGVNVSSRVSDVSLLLLQLR